MKDTSNWPNVFNWPDSPIVNRLSNWCVYWDKKAFETKSIEMSLIYSANSDFYRSLMQLLLATDDINLVETLLNDAFEVIKGKDVEDENDS